MRLRTLLPLCMLGSAMPAAAEVVSGPAAIIDGDTLEIADRRIRLFGIDAPEMQQSCTRDGEQWACGEESKRQLAALVGTQSADCAGDEVDQYGRLVAVCSVGGTEINGTMVEAGWATAFRRYSQAYVPAEVRARARKLGLWRSTFALPEEYRTATSEQPPERRNAPAARRTAAAAPRPSGECLIKGNRNRRGEWIYHLPGRPYYAHPAAHSTPEVGPRYPVGFRAPLAPAAGGSTNHLARAEDRARSEGAPPSPPSRSSAEA